MCLFDQSRGRDFNFSGNLKFIQLFIFNHHNPSLHQHRSPMAPKPAQPSNKASQPKANDAQTHDVLVFTWAKRLYDAIKHESQYAKVHDVHFKEFDLLRDAAQARGSTKLTMLNHVASQGYQPNVHFMPLKTTIFNFCEQKPVAGWKGPPDQFSHSPTPSLEAPPTQPSPTRPPPTRPPTVSQPPPASKPLSTSNPPPTSRPPTSNSPKRPATKPPPPK